MDTAFSQFPEECSVKHHELETPYTCSSVIVSEKPANSAVLEKLDKVSIQKINCDLNIAVDNEKASEFAVDEEEGESVEDGDNQGRKHISSLTSRHYAGHVRVFKGKLDLMLPLFFSGFVLQEIKQFVLCNRNMLRVSVAMEIR